MKSLKMFVAIAIVVAVSFSLVSFEMGWVVPAADAAIRNPVTTSAASVAAGKTEYTAKCKMCHGATGVGVGTMAKPSNFTLPAFKAQTDGAIFYKINSGFDKMPSYKTKIADAKTKWNIVNYLRTL